MAQVESCELPPGALLRRYREGGAYADCYFTDVDRRASHAEYVEAFYTTALFKVERRILARFVSRPSTDAQARQLAAGELDSFAAWSVEAREKDQLLLADYRGRTRSWLMVAEAQRGALPGTRLYFGSAVVPVAGARPGTHAPGLAFRSLLGFHKLYSRALLSAAASRLAQRSP